MENYQNAVILPLKKQRIFQTALLTILIFEKSPPFGLRPASHKFLWNGNSGLKFWADGKVYRGKAGLAWIGNTREESSTGIYSWMDFFLPISKEPYKNQAN